MRVYISSLGRIGLEIKKQLNENQFLGTLEDIKIDNLGDVIIDFSSPSYLNKVLDMSRRFNLPLVIGTTGYSQEQMDKIIEHSKMIKVFYASNFSKGIFLFDKIIKLLKQYDQDDYEFDFLEKHHREKKDAPSGTLLTLANNFNNYSLKSMHNYPKDKKEIGVFSLRGGTVIGEHQLNIYLEDEQVSINHQAHSKTLFAKGAIKAAIYLINKQEIRLYGLEDLYGC